MPKLVYEWRKLKSEAEFLVCVDCGQPADIGVKVRNCGHLFFFCMEHFEGIRKESKNIYVEV